MGIASLTGGREEVKKDVVGVQHWTSCSWWPAHYRIIDNNHVYIYINDIINIVFFCVSFPLHRSSAFLAGEKHG